LSVHTNKNGENGKDHVWMTSNVKTSVRSGHISC